MTISTAPHEIDVNFILGVHPSPGIPDYGLKPFYAIDSVIKNHDGWETEGKPSETMQFGGEEYALVLDYQDSGIDPWESPEFQLENVREYRFYFVSKDSPHYSEAPADQQDRIKGGSVHIAPRWPDMTSDGSPINVPDYGAPYVNAEIQGSNIDHRAYNDLLCRIFDAFGINGEYAANPHPDSNIQDLARYVRLDRGSSGSLFGSTGPLARTHAVIESDREGYRKHVEDHREIPGYYVTTSIRGTVANQIIRGHDLGKECKHYYPNHPSEYDPNDAPYHPKFEVSYQTSLTEDTVRWNDLDDAIRELDETVVNMLDWADIAPDADNNVWVGFDPYWTVENTTKSRKMVKCPLPEIENEQERRVMSLWGDMTESDRSVTELLLTDGGEVSPQAAAEQTGNTYRTIREVVNRMDGLIRHTYGSLEIESKHIQQELQKRVEAAGERFESEIGTAAMELADAANERLRSRWDQARRRYGVTVRDDSDCQELIEVGYKAQDRREANEIIDKLRTHYMSEYSEQDLYGAHIQIETLEDGIIRSGSLSEWSDRGNSRSDYAEKESEAERAREGFDFEAWKAAGYPPVEDWEPPE